MIEPRVKVANLVLLQVLLARAHVHCALLGPILVLAHHNVTNATLELLQT